MLALVAGQDVEPVGRLGWHRRALAGRAEGGPGPGDLHRGSRGPPRAQDPRPAARTATRPTSMVEPDTGIITGCRADPSRRAGHTPTPRSGSTCWPQETDQRLEVLGDSAYGTGDAAGRGGRVPGTPRSSSRGRCARPWRAGSPSTSSPSSSPPTTSPARVTCPNGITRPITGTRRGDLRGGLSRTARSAARCTTSARGRTLNSASPPRAAARAPGPRARPGVPGRLPPAPADGRTLDLLAGRRPEPAAAVPRNRSQRSLAAPPRRRAQPAPSAQPRPHPHQRAPGQ